MLNKLITLLTVLIIFTSHAFAASSLEKEIMTDLKNFDGKVGIYAKNLRTRKVIDYNENVVFPTASTSKLVVALATYKYLYPKAQPDKQYFYDENVRYMMVVSDNQSFYELLDELAAYKPDALKRVIKDLRLKNTRIHSQEAFKKYSYQSVTTPYEMAKVLEAIYSEKYIGKEKSRLMKDELANTIFRDEIPRYMLTPVMHKVGQLDNVLCDVGIVDDGKDQILISAYTVTDQPVEYASDFIADISSKLYNALRTR